MASGTATTADYWALAGDLLIEAGEREGTADIVLAPTDDDIDEDDETLEVWGSTTRSRSAAQLQVSREQITIRDDDTAGVTVTPTELSVVEGLSSSYRVALDTQPSADVTVAVSGHSGTDITVYGDTLINDTLTFTADNWNTAQTVTVSAAQDNDVADKADVTLTHTVTGTAEYAGVTADSVTVSITDDDTAGVTVSESELEIDEGATAIYTVRLDTEPTADVTVAIAGHSGTDITLSGATPDLHGVQLEHGADGDGDRGRGRRRGLRRCRDADPHRRRRRLCRCSGDGDRHHRREGRWLCSVRRRRPGRRGRRERGVHREHQRGRRRGRDG